MQLYQNRQREHEAGRASSRSLVRLHSAKEAAIESAKRTAVANGGSGRGGGEG